MKGNQKGWILIGVLGSFPHSLRISKRSPGGWRGTIPLPDLGAFALEFLKYGSGSTTIGFDYDSPEVNATPFWVCGGALCLQIFGAHGNDDKVATK